MRRLDARSRVGESIDGRAVRAGHEVAVQVDRQLNGRVAELILHRKFGKGVGRDHTQAGEGEIMTPRSNRAVPSLRRAFGEHLRTVRVARGLSQERLRLKAGLSGKFVGEVERGEKSISLDSLWRVARALRLPLGAMIPGASRRGAWRRRRS